MVGKNLYMMENELFFYAIRSTWTLPLHMPKYDSKALTSNEINNVKKFLVIIAVQIEEVESIYQVNKNSS